MPWRNGAGSTREVATDRPGAFGWRVSVAELTANAPFSQYPGYDRSFVLARGGPICLTIDGHERLMEAGNTITFSGSAEVIATVLMPAEAINVMTRRTEYRHELAFAHAPVEVEADLVMMLENGTLHRQRSLALHSALMATQGRRIALTGRGLVLSVRFARIR